MRVDVDPAMAALLKRMGEFERDLNTIAKDTDAPRRDDVGEVVRDARWNCNKCGYLLGMYDVGQDIMRTRYKDHIVYVRTGPGGFVQVICRGCSEVNTQQHVTAEALAAAKGDG